MRVLMVEDEELIRGIVGLDLITAGYEVDPAATVDQALARLDPARKPDVLFTDIRLREMGRDGWFVGERFREAFPDLPIIYATGHADEAPKSVGGSVFLRKPYKTSEVIAAIEHLTRRRARTT